MIAPTWNDVPALLLRIAAGLERIAGLMAEAPPVEYELGGEG